MCVIFFFFNLKTAYEMRISDWSSDVCSSDLSGQFLIDSEASLSGVEARPIGGRAPTAAAKPVNGPALYETVGRIEQITPRSVTFSHEPVPALGWPAMTMTFRLLDPTITRGLKTGDRVRFDFDQPPTGPTVRRIDRQRVVEGKSVPVRDNLVGRPILK